MILIISRGITPLSPALSRYFLTENHRQLTCHSVQFDAGAETNDSSVVKVNLARLFFKIKVFLAKVLKPL